MESKKTGFLVVILAGLLIVVLTGSGAWQTLKFRALAIQANGTILGNRTIAGSKSTFKYSVSYKAGDNKDDTAQIFVKNAFLKSGEKIQIYYDPSNPHTASVNVSVFNNIAGVIIGLLLLLWGFPGYRNEVKKENARTKHKEG